MYNDKNNIPMKKYKSIFDIIAGPVSALAFCIAANFNPLLLVAAFCFYGVLLYVTAILHQDDPAE